MSTEERKKVREGDRCSEQPLGHGLIGMRERVHLYGGWMDAGPMTGGGFRVEAVLPLAVEAS